MPAETRLFGTQLLGAPVTFHLALHSLKFIRYDPRICFFFFFFLALNRGF